MNFLGCLSSLFGSPSPYLPPNEAQALSLPDFISRSVESAPTFAYDQNDSQRMGQIFQSHLATGNPDLRWVISGIFQAAQNSTAIDAERRRLQWVHTLVDKTMQQLATMSGGGGGNFHGQGLAPPQDHGGNHHGGKKQALYSSVVGGGPNSGPVQAPPAHAPPMAVDSAYPMHPVKSQGAAVGTIMETHFFPSDASFRALTKALNQAHKTLDVCVFNITDDDLANCLISAKRRGVQVRIIADDEQCTSQGSDVMRLSKEHDIPVRLDNDPSHMHNKFAIIDDHLLINGSYNWTKGARRSNRENIMITDAPQAVQGYRQEYERLWKEFSR
ncbi:hypothetical protein IWQ60_001370 [Tieghemiomyces parasiticus]|uniref:Mitochondrial cardiolipin hydrolase n=1 Tax=Tieghemiomyces parasiticus TaxID=78921 RepID=A0A9W8DYD3_9FUNG|nr:hypothetical protein IWQ60_001370 [Tieghemiomyces parasiticus]